MNVKNERSIMCDCQIDSSEIQNELDPCSPGIYVESSGRTDVMIINQNLKDINPISCGQSYCEAGHGYGPKRRAYYLLHYVVSGKGFFVCNGEEYNLTKGDIFVIKPNERTFYRADTDNPWHYRWVGFTTSLDLSNIISTAVIKAPECDYLFKQITESSHIQNLKEYYICGKLFEIITLLAKKTDIERSISFEYVLSAKNYIEINYNDSSLTISSLADKLSLDRSYFSALFKKHMKKSPMQYLIDFRLTKAAELITFNTYNLSEIAYMCGYNDIFNFSKMFKKKFNVNPSQYGKTHNDV